MLNSNPEVRCFSPRNNLELGKPLPLLRVCCKIHKLPLNGGQRMGQVTGKRFDIFTSDIYAQWCLFYVWDRGGYCVICCFEFLTKLLRRWIRLHLRSTFGTLPKQRDVEHGHFHRELYEPVQDTCCGHTSCTVWSDSGATSVMDIEGLELRNVPALACWGNSMDILNELRFELKRLVGASLFCFGVFFVLGFFFLFLKKEKNWFSLNKEQSKPSHQFSPKNVTGIQCSPWSMPLYHL